MTFRRIDGFSATILMSLEHHFEPNTNPELAFFGMDSDTAGRVAVLDGQLVGRSNHASAVGLLVARESFSGQVYFDRVPLDSTLRMEDGGRAMWLSSHRGEMTQGILRVSAGRAALNGIEIEPVGPTTTLAAFGMGEAYANEAATAAAQTASDESQLAKVYQLQPAA
jgi:hypothetical protein